ncbi:MAG: phage holin family protein [Chloroflexota bacterium]|nr:MAG: phage holin family protein [Chloroflexota bacterium]
MTTFLVHAIANGIALWVISTQLNIGIGFRDSWGGWPSLALAAVILGAVNALVRPILSTVTCIINVLTLGLFSFIISAVMLWLTSWIVTWLGVATGMGFTFTVQDVLAALIGAILIGLLNAVLTRVLSLVIRG